MDDVTEGDDASIDFEEFRAWVEETADLQNTSGESILEQLVSTYWILRELSETVEGTDYADMLAPTEAEAGEESGTNLSEDELIELIEEAGVDSPLSESTQSGNAVDPSLIHLIQTLQASQLGGHAPQSAATADTDEEVLDRIVDSLSGIERQLDELVTADAPTAAQQSPADTGATAARGQPQPHSGSLEARLERVYEELRGAVNTTAQAASTSAKQVDTLRTEVSDLRGDFEHEIQRLDGDVTAAEERTEAVESDTETLARRLEQLEERFEAHASETSDQMENIVASLERNTRDAEEHLQSLYEKDDEIIARLADLEDRLGEDAEDRGEAARLADLRELAQDQGIRSASCEHCGEDVDLGLLTGPRCPRCERLFTDIETDRFLWRVSHALQTRSPAEEVSNQERSNPEDAEEDGSAPYPTRLSEADDDPPAADDADSSLKWVER